MSATSRLKQLLFIAAALALVSLGLVAALSPASPARADEPCVPRGAYTETINHPAETHTVHHDAVTETIHHPAVTETVPGVWANWAPNDTRGPQDYVPGYPVDNVGNGEPRGTWIVHDQGVPPGQEGPDGVYQQGAGNSPWFYRQAEKVTVITEAYDEVVVIEEAYDETVVDKEAWTETINHPEVECPDQGPDCEQDPTAEGCPPIEEKPAVCHPVEGNGELGNGWNLISPAQASSHIDEALFPDGVYWKHETSDGRHDIYSEDGETCPDAEEPEICPEGTDFAGEAFPIPGDVESCDKDVDPGPETCPEGTDFAGEEFPVPGDVESCDKDDEEDVCPEGSDHAGEELPAGGLEECDDDDVDPGPDCEEDPSQKKCDEDKPPVVVPDDGSTPNNGPTVRGASATAPTAAAAAGTTVAGTPAARVPTAVNAGLAPQELAGDGGTMGLLGIAAALLGAALVGLTVRPRRRIGAASRART